MNIHLISIKDLNKKQLTSLVNRAVHIKSYPQAYRSSLRNKNFLSFFEMPSLRTKLSFEVAVDTMSGNCIDYQASSSPWGAKKESIEDVAQVMSRYVDLVFMRIHDHKALETFAKHSSVPVVNAMTTFGHPCQILSDLLTLHEEFESLSGLTLTYLGDSNNNVTHSLMFACALLGIDMRIACPKSATYRPHASVINIARKLRKKGSLSITSDAKKAVTGADVVYTDSWMSYRIAAKEKKKRMKALKPYRVTSSLMRKAAKDAVFMHCLPALRGMEVDASVIDGKQSIVFDQAENRLYMQKAILYDCFH